MKLHPQRGPVLIALLMFWAAIVCMIFAFATVHR